MQNLIRKKLRNIEINESLLSQYGPKSKGYACLRVMIKEEWRSIAALAQKQAK